MRDQPRQPPPNARGVPIIGGKKIAEQITFQLAKFKLHPPVGYDKVYVMMMAILATGSAGAYKVVNAFGGQFQAYLAEDCELGNKHDIVMVTTDDEGHLGFMIAKPVEDDPDAKKPKH